MSREDARSFVSCGPVRLPSLAIRIADAEDQELPEEKIGRLQLRGAVVTPGYVANAVANEAAFTADGWLNTGDLGFIAGGELYITGREAETVVVRGVNVYSHEVEEVVARADVGAASTLVAAARVDPAFADEASEAIGLLFVPAGDVDSAVAWSVAEGGYTGMGTEAVTRTRDAHGSDGGG